LQKPGSDARGGIEVPPSATGGRPFFVQLSLPFSAEQAMKLVIPKERDLLERRMAGSPDAVKRLRDLGFEVIVEAGAGAGAGFPDAALQEAGATLTGDIAEALGAADVVLRVRGPAMEDDGWEFRRMRPGAVLIGFLAPWQAHERIAAYAEHGLAAFTMEFMPRITRAQGMDALSSQANLGGYAAVIEGARLFGRAFPMMVTAAGTIAPARVLILGAGVAGLQAIATARRLGAIVSAMDVRPAAREQVESLGATFVEVDSDEKHQAETTAGYAREMSANYRQRQAGKLHEHLKRIDVVVTTALIPGRPAPVLVTAEMVADMKPGSVIIDMAAEQGGNCELSENGRTVVKHGVTIVGDANLAGHVAADASALYARNLVNFLTLMVDTEHRLLEPDRDDEILKATLVCRDGRIVNPVLAQKEAS
jgi:NAD(P) transhydrogenase subunit alpha